VSVRVRVALEISKAQSSSVRPAPHLVLIVVSRPERPVDLPASLDRLEQLHPLATHHQPDGVLSVKVGMRGPFAKHPVRRAAAGGAAEETLEQGARREGRLRPRLRLPPDRVRGGGFLAIRHQCFSVAPGAYSACHSSRVAETAGARMTVGREISPECSTDERREWQNGAAAVAISSRPPPGSLGSRMIRSIICERQLAGCGCFLPYLLVGATGRSLGTAGARPLSTVSVHRAIAVDRKPRAVRFVSGSLVPQYGTASTIQRGAVRAKRTCLFFLPPRPFHIPKILVDFF